MFSILWLGFNPKHAHQTLADMLKALLLKLWQNDAHVTLVEDSGPLTDSCTESCKI